MSEQLLPPGCIQANPDIAGIGVRVAIYSQNFLSLTLAIIALGNRHVSWKEMLTVEIQSMSVLLTACALLLSAVVQAATFGMSTYHALIVLNLAWMNNTNTLVYAILFRYQRVTNPFPHPNRRRRVVDEPPPKRRAIPLLAIGSLHLSFAAGFGLWFWAKAGTFGASAQCASQIPVSLFLFGRGVPVTSRAMQRMSLATYSVIAIPVLNLVVAVGVVYGLATIFSRMGELLFGLSTTTAFFAPGYISVGLLVGINVVLATDTETMINRTKALVQPGESQWTFGQTLAIFLLVLPLRDIFLTLFGQDEHLLGRGMVQNDRWSSSKRTKRRYRDPKKCKIRPGSPQLPTKRLNRPLSRPGSLPSHRLPIRKRIPQQAPHSDTSRPGVSSSFAERAMPRLLPVSTSQAVITPSFSMPPIPPRQLPRTSFLSSGISSASLESLYLWTCGSSQPRPVRSPSSSSSRTWSPQSRSPDSSTLSPSLSRSPSLIATEPLVSVWPLSRRSRSLPPTPSSATLRARSLTPTTPNPASPAPLMEHMVSFAPSSPFPVLRSVGDSLDDPSRVLNSVPGSTILPHQGGVDQGGRGGRDRGDASLIISYPSTLRVGRVEMNYNNSRPSSPAG